MSLTPGSRFGPYEIVSSLGAGGMGEVFKARDTRLDRCVALKILPPHLAADADAKARFEREAKAIGALNHPHICTLHDLGQAAGIDYLVMELVEGETLARRLERGALNTGQALTLAIEIADALDKAHRAGIIHRDLKPSNVMVTASGAKLLDFGLAKSRGALAITSVSGAATQPPLTGAGTILGSLNYMAPEQLEGREADHRSDIFAFGCVLYEMVTGKMAFAGTSTASVIAAILERDPAPLSTHLASAAPQLDQVVSKCLAKSADDRWQSARDLLDVLTWLRDAESRPSETRAVATGGFARVRWPLACLIASAATGLLVWSGSRRVPEASQPVTRFALSAPPEHRIAIGASRNMAVSPDGMRVVFSATPRNGVSQLYLRRLDQLAAEPLRGTELASQPFFSPDGEAIGFTAHGNFQVVSLSGGSPLVIQRVFGSRGATWLSDNTIVFAATDRDGLWRVPATGGSAVQLTSLADGEIGHRWPEYLPGGKAVLFSIVRPGSAGPAVAAVKLDAGERRVLLEGAAAPRYLSTGHLVVSRGEDLLAAPFDLGGLRLIGSLVPVLQGVAASAATDAQAAMSATGSLVYMPAGSNAARRLLVWVDRRGRVDRIPAPPRGYQSPRLSPDATRLALDVDDVSRQEIDVWVYHFARGTLSRFTFGAGQDETGLWSPDGQRLAFTADRPGERGRLVFWKRADGGGTENRFAAAQGHLHLLSWSPDGELIAVDNGGFASDVSLLRVKDGTLEPLLNTPFNEREPAFSPDGRWLAYVSNESGREEVYIRSFPGPGGVWQVSTEGGREPRWTRKGAELVYRSATRMMAAGIRSAGGSVEIGTPAVLFEGDFEPVGVDPSYDVTADGERFLMFMPDSESEDAQLVVVQNWAAEVVKLLSRQQR